LASALRWIARCLATVTRVSASRRGADLPALDCFFFAILGHRIGVGDDPAKGVVDAT
jgi:hypothetical protein